MIGQRIFGRIDKRRSFTTASYAAIGDETLYPFNKSYDLRYLKILWSLTGNIYLKKYSKQLAHTIIACKRYQKYIFLNLFNPVINHNSVCWAAHGFALVC